MKVPIVSGIYSDADQDWRTAYPVNLEPIPKVSGVSEGHLKSAEGIVHFALGQGVDRGGVNWREKCYRVMGTKFVRVDANGAIFEIGDVGDGGAVTMSYGFDYLAITSGGRLYFYDGSMLSQNTDEDLGVANSVQWIDGYFMTTDGENLVVTELGNPFSVLPFRYGSSEVDPDDVVSVLRLNNEIYAINRHTIEAFTNVGGSFFPFQVIDGTQIYRGAVGSTASAVFLKGIAFVGSGRNEAPGVYLLSGGSDVKISTREIDLQLEALSVSELADIVCEVRVFGNREILYVHLADRTWCYDGRASATMGQPAWWSLSSAGEYRARSFVWCYGSWIVGDPQSSNLGTMSDSETDHWGVVVPWEFTTPVLFDETRGAVIHSCELSVLTGGTKFGEQAAIGLEYSEDGILWSQRRFVDMGKPGARPRIKWTKLGVMDARRMFRVTGDSNARLSASRFDVEVEQLAW